jgi:hypothetical protein
MAWILRLVKIGAEGEGQAPDGMEINRPDDPSDIAAPGLTLSKRTDCWQGSNGKSSPHRSETTRLGGQPAHAVAAVAG